MSAERYAGSGRRSKVQQVRTDIGEIPEEQQTGALVALSNVGGSGGPDQPAEEHHLGDRLTGFVDGELDHDLRDRVQAHLATCPDCLAQAEEERRVKQLLAEAVTPEPSALLMSRLLAVGTDWPDGGDSAIGGSRLDGGSFGRGTGGGSFGGGAAFGTGGLASASPPPFGQPSPMTAQRGTNLRAMARLRGVVAPPDGRPAGTAAERAVRPSAPRGRRFAFAAAGAFSVAAVALTGFGGLGGVDATTDEPYGSRVSPIADTGAGADEVSPLNVPLRAPVQAGYPVSVPVPFITSALPAAPSPAAAGHLPHDR
ncbi:anti-sigma factor family protein [Peterkaempfera bronchialis]|uniref:Zf-HC2 domain-containing protein n=1 Tax=Peterkaempfera bronchialis TaxID=2126346 RepID=A0A345SZZ8_9ACTN|nr:zf-HC2 domain-containing protein [Peterkaempfera bronchialis]AXI79303.1 zf-HC2 domain-containing protein [Peterkaempfera bronchialis]